MFDKLLLILNYVWMGFLVLMIVWGCTVFVVQARRMIRDDKRKEAIACRQKRFG